MAFIRLLAFVCLLFVISCGTSKKTTSDNNSVSVDLDSVEITANRDNPYRASASKDFDLLHTKLEVQFDYVNQYLLGKATITLKPHFYPQYTLNLDAKQFDIKEVSLMLPGNTKKTLDYEYDSLELTIRLDKQYTAGEVFKIFIDYKAKPEERQSGGSAAISEDKGLYFINPLATDSLKPIQIWTQGETESNSCWFPTIDKPNQKMTNEIYITHLKKYVSLSNGTLISSTSLNDSLVTDYWKMDLPHAPYLVMMAVGDFAVIQDRWRDVPVQYYVEKKFAPYAKQIFGNTPEMMEFFSQKLGFDFPWPKYAQVVVRDYVSGAMENTSATLHSEVLQRTSRELLDETHEDVISHELFHQWFGDLVTSESWSNTPLNESFATYGEYLWDEYKYGRDYADLKLNENLERYLIEAKDKNVDLIRFYYDDKEDMFDRHSYEKGGLVLHYLRKIVGDDAFFKSIELYLKTNQFKPVEIHQLRLAFEEVTGKDFNWFFNQWFLNQGHPVLDINYTYTPDSVFVRVTQKQNIDNNLVYQLPFRIDIWYGKIVSSYPVVLKKKSEVFSFKNFGIPDLIDADADRSILCEKTENKSIDNYIFQYHNTPLYLQRFEALKKIADLQKGNSMAYQTMRSALKDPSYYLRQLTINQLITDSVSKDSLLEQIAGLAERDPKSAVRKSALERLSKEKSERFSSLFERMVGDSSYDVVAAALKSLNETNSKTALAFAKLFETETNRNIQNAVADIYAKAGDSVYQGYFEKRLNESNGLNKYSLLYYYANFLTRMDPPLVLAGIKNIEIQGMITDNHFIEGASKGSIKRISKWFEDKKKKVLVEIEKEKGNTEKAELQEILTNYTSIVTECDSSLQRISKKIEAKKK